MADSRTGEAVPGGASTLDTVNALLAGTLMERMGIRFEAVSAGHLVASMPVAGNTQPYGLLHGGASCALAETLGSIGATLHAATTGQVALGVEINASHHRTVSAGRVTGTATAVHLGRTLAGYEVVVTDDGGHRVCTSRVTCLLRDPDRIPAAPRDVVAGDAGTARRRDDGGGTAPTGQGA